MLSWLFCLFTGFESYDNLILLLKVFVPFASRASDLELRLEWSRWCCFQVGANAGVVGMAKEHLGLALALGVPVFVVVTKIDMCPPNILQETLHMLHKILKSPGCRKMPVLVQTVDDVIVSAMNFTSER